MLSIDPDTAASKPRRCFVYRRQKGVMILFPMAIFGPAVAGSGLSKESEDHDVSPYDSSA
jgi:hypothetical protein